MQLRPHQRLAMAGIVAAIKDGRRRPLLQAVCGFGKTVIAAEIVRQARAKHKRIAFCVPSLSLIDQTFERFVENGIDPSDMGVIQGDHAFTRPHAPIQIATAQTLARRTLPDVDVVVIDEAHVQHKVYQTWMGLPEWQDRLFIGLTATPWAKGMGKWFNHLVKAISMQELIDAGFLAPFRVFAPSKPDLTGVRTVAGDYHEGDLAERMNQPQLVADIVETWLARGENRPTLCFCVDRNHARSVHDQFEQVGIPVAYVDAFTPREERTEIGSRLAAGEIKVVCNIGCLTTGVDWDVRCLILARPTKSEILFVQIIGRALRTAEGKADAIILDHSDTHMRLGMVTDIDHDAMDDGSGNVAGKRGKDRADKVPLPKCCPSCTALMPVGTRVCLACGTELPVPTVQVADGELVAINHTARKTSATQAIAAMGKQAVYSQLGWIRIDRRRKPGWQARAYRDVFGVWPRGLHETPMPPTPEVLAFVRHKDIAFAHRRANTTQEAAHA